MTHDELQQFKQLVSRSLRMRVRAAEIHLQAVELAVRTTNGDIECERDARRILGFCRHGWEQTRETLKRADIDMIAEAYRQHKG